MERLSFEDRIAAEKQRFEYTNKAVDACFQMFAEYGLSVGEAYSVLDRVKRKIETDVTLAAPSA